MPAKTYLLFVEKIEKRPVLNRNRADKRAVQRYYIFRKQRSIY